MVLIVIMVGLVRRGKNNYRERKRLEINKLLADKKQSYGTINNNICV